MALSNMIPIAISPPLREVAELRIRELDRLKERFKSRYGLDVPCLTNVTLRERISSLVKDVQLHDGHLEEDDDLTIIAACVEQTEFDNCISDAKLLKYEEQILGKLQKQMHRYESTFLHLQLMVEAMSVEQTAKSPNSAFEANSHDNEDFEVVDTGSEVLQHKFEAEAFAVKEIDVEALEDYLTELVDHNGVVGSLSCPDTLRNKIQCYAGELLEGEADIEEDDLEWCILNILKNSLISEDRRKTLEIYLQNQIALRELVSALNMRSVRDWNWSNADKGLPIVTRQDAEGNYHIVIEEDLVDMLFLHCIALGWSERLKDVLSRFVQYLQPNEDREISSDGCKEHQFFLEATPLELLEKQLEDPQTPCHLPSMPPPPPPTLGVPCGVYVTASRTSRVKHKKKSTKRPFSTEIPPPPPPPPPFFEWYPPPDNLTTLDAERRTTYNSEFFLSRLPALDGCRHTVVPVEEVQAKMIKTLAAELKIRAALNGQVSCSVVEFRSIASSLPHQVILTALKFLGVPEVVVDFFSRFLGANLSIGSDAHIPSARTLARTCGVPERHTMELFLTEAVMVFAELAVKKKTGAYLYRLGSRCYFVGTEEQNKQAIRELRNFSDHTKLEFDVVPSEPGSLHIGFLDLTGSSVTIDRSEVEAYAIRTKKLLSSQTTFYDWVRVWNNTLGTYSAHLFGPLIDGFGKPHLSAVQASYKHIFSTIFGNGSLTTHVKDMLCARSGIARAMSPLALEAFIHLPHAFGGLGVKNPLITLNLARPIGVSPHPLIEEYLMAETTYYQEAASNWSILSASQIDGKATHVFADANAMSTALGPVGLSQTFISKERLTRHREYALFPFLPDSLIQPPPPMLGVPPPPPPPPPRDIRIPYLVGLYRALMAENVDEPNASDIVKLKVGEARRRTRWAGEAQKDKWVLGVYGEECCDWWGGMEIWCEKLVPKAILMAVRGEDLSGDGDDDSSSMTSV
ncbi:hypothetical protein G6514_004058 [Epicoccum nigrum]|nr:hypothetical protein G6514_004058 [Epicoccum nigrum]